MRLLFDTVRGVFLTPGATLGRVVADKRWVAGFLLICVTVFIVTFITAPHSLAASKEMIKDTPLSEYLEDDPFEEFQSLSGARLVMASLWAVFLTSIALIFSTFFLYLFYGIAGVEGTFGNFFALVAYASLIDTVLPALLELGVVLSGINFMKIFSLSGVISLVTGNPPGSFAFLALSQINLFAVWFLFAVAAGISAYARMDLKKCLIVALLYFIFIASVKTAFSFLLMKIAGM